MADLTRKTANLVDQNVFATTYTSYVTSANGIITFNSVTSAMSSDGVTVDIPANTIFTCIPLEVTNGIISFRIRFEGETEQDRQMVYLYDSNGEPNTIAPVTLSFAVKKITIFWSNASGKTAAFKNFMVNAGSTPLPYEPYGWVHSLRKLGTETETIQSGDTIYANGQPISTYSIKGNTVQNGTPTPSNPVSVNGVGDMSSNLLDSGSTTYTVLDVTITANNGYYTLNGQSSRGGGRTYHVSKDIMLDSGTYVMKLIGTAEGATPYIQNGSTIIGYNGYAFTLNEPTSIYLGFNFDNSMPYFDNVSFGVMLIQSSTAPTTFEPYGYKIPISTSQGSAVNYLGSVQTTRQIKKLVLTGQETDWTKSSTYQGSFYAYIVTNCLSENYTAYCSHLTFTTLSQYAKGNFCFNGTSGVTTKNCNLWFNQFDSSTTVEEFKTYLQQQYANGTPVTVWYVLATEETEIVNEPLMKIGDYADSISNAVSIPTTDGANSITVDTTVQPSEFSATWTGWHDSSVQEYKGGVGNQKFDYQRTEGLLLQQYINQEGQAVENTSYNMSYLIPVTPNATYMWNFGSTVQHRAPTVAFYDSNGNYISVAMHGSTTAFSFDTPINCAYVRVPIYISTKTAAMLNEGSTALPYEDYQYAWV